MDYCVMCKSQLTDEKGSVEHIIPNAIGGRIKVKSLICEKCNNDLFGKYDASLSKDFEIICNTLNIKRERGKPIKIKGTYKGREYYLSPDGKPEQTHIIYNKTKKEDGTEKHQIIARNEKEIRKALENVKRKHPEIDVDSAMQHVNKEQKYLKSGLKIELKIGGEDTFKAIAKIAFLYLLYKNPTFSGDLEPIRGYLNGQKTGEFVYFYIPEKYVIPQVDFSVNHIISIESVPENSSLVAYIEFFSTASFLVLLSENCNEDISIKYIYDVMERTDVTEEYDINEDDIPREKCKEIIKNDPLPVALLSTRLNELGKFISKIRTQKFFDRAIKSAMNDVFGKVPDGTLITSEMISEFSEILAKNLLPLLASNTSMSDDLNDGEVEDE